MKLERNLIIKEDRLAGMKYKDIAIKHGITTERVRQILAGLGMTIIRQRKSK